MRRNPSSAPILSPAARQDFREIMRWTGRNFGMAAALRYRVLIEQAVSDIGADPERLGSKERPDLMMDHGRTYHLECSRSRVTGIKVKQPRHFLLYRRRADGRVEVARILHDGRDLARHIPDDCSSEE